MPETISTASASVAASMTANPATGSPDRMNGPSLVATPAPSWLRTCTGGPAMPIAAPDSCSRASCACAASRTPSAVPSYPARSPYPIVTNFATAGTSLSTCLPPTASSGR